MQQVDKPNLILPLAASYNSRALAGLTNTITNSIDQRKVNSIYMPVMNHFTGKTTLYLVKRPGTTINASSFGTSGQVAHVYEFMDTAFWVFSTSGNDIRASDSSSTNVIVTAAGYKPAFVDRTSISGTNTCVVQLRNGSFAQRVFFASAVGSWTEIVDTVFTGLTLHGKMEFLDGFAFILDGNNRIYNSNLNTLATWPASSYLTKSIKQDLPRGLARFKNQILAFGRSSMEVFVNAGNTTGSPLKTVPSVSNYGIGMDAVDVIDLRHYYAYLDDRIYWSAQANQGIFTYDGSRVEKVSTPAIDKIRAENVNIYSTARVCWEGGRGVAFALDKPDATTQRWLMFFPAWNDWFEWNSTVVMPMTGNSTDQMLGVGSNQHRLYVLSNNPDNWQDDGTNYQFMHRFRLPSDGNHGKTMPMAGVIGDTARSALNLSIEFSDDDYQTWSTARNIDMTSAKKAIYRNGGFRERAVRITYTGALEVRLEKFIARVE